MWWVSLERIPSLEKMTSEDICLTHVHGIVARETPNVCDLSFRDPDCFQSGQLRTQIRLWEFWTATNRQRMSLNAWSMGWMSKSSLSPLRDHLWVSSVRARNPRLEFLRTTILANSFRSCYGNNSATYRVRSDPCLG